MFTSNQDVPSGSWVSLLATQTLAANATTFGPFNINPNCPVMEGGVYIPGYAGGDILELNFNNDIGTTQYASASMEGNSVPTTEVATVATGIRLASTAITTPRHINFRITQNLLNKAKHVAVWGGNWTEAAAAAPLIVQGAGGWTGTALISQIGLRTRTSAMLAGLKIWLMGRADIG